MTPEELLRDVWAKSPRQGSSRGESLHAHTRRTVTMLGQLRTRLPGLASALEDPLLWQRAFWACTLHDIGKAAAPFQQILRGAAAAWSHRHEVASLAFLSWALGQEEEEIAWIGAAVASHHKDGPEIDARYPVEFPEDMDLGSMFAGFSDDTLAALAAWLREMPARWAADLGLTGVPGARAVPDRIDGRRFRSSDGPDAVLKALAAYERLRTRLRREPADSVLNRRALAYRGLLLLADRLASAQAGNLKLLELPSVQALFADETVRPRDYQRTVGGAVGSVVVSAPTGSGKTEAALWWASTQQCAEPHRRSLIYLLPYQASLNAMHQRLRRTLGTDVGLLHGRATQALYRLLLRDGYESDRAERIARRATDLARLQRPAVHVATPYQLLRAAYRLRGYEMTWAALHGALLVVDEVHAYDPSRLGLLLGMLTHLVHRWDVRVCTLTATMPSWLRTLLVDRLGATFISASDDDFRAFARHELHLVPGDLRSVLPTIVERVRAGQAVLVGANTVSSAQTIYHALRETLGKEQTRLLHSRFTGRDRLRKENELMELVGLYRSKQVALALVATQTIEVSLNLDFDTIYTEPAPIEALAQRFGRVNRTRRLIRAPVYVLTEPDDGQHVYDSRLVRSTLATLTRRDGQLLDEAELIRMLDEVYGGGLADEFQREVIHHELIFARSCLGDLRAFESDDELADQFDQLFDGVEIVPLDLVEEFQQALTRSVLDAQGVLVPITYRYLKRFERAGRVKRVSGSFIAIDASYDNEIGLLLIDE